MAMRIHRLSPEVANRIAAGEVVERPASVVKELVENSVDAGAERIAVEVEDGGLALIRVIDDGCGMSPEDAVLAFERHATSKLSNAEQLDSISTMGFRGEALPSVASVSKVRLITRERGAELGTEVTGEGPAMSPARPLPADFGTKVEIKDLFFNTPARLKYLKTPATEARRIVDVMSRLALAHPDVSFSLWVDGRKVLSTPVGGSLADAVAAVVGTDTARAMIPIDSESHGIAVTGFIGTPEMARAGRDGQFIIVNGRPVSSKTVWSAVDRAYDRAIPAGRRALVVLRIEMPPQVLDVNVHPAKTEVRFASDSQVFSAVLNAVTSGLRTMEAAPRMSPQPPPASGGRVSAGVPHWAERQQSMDGMINEAPEWIYGERQAAPVPPSPQAPTWAPAPPAVALGSQRVDGRPVAGMRLLGQLGRTYILLESDDGLVIVDQHVAHERVLVEEYRRQWAAQAPSTQLLLTPQIVSLAPVEMQAALENIDTLRRLGFDAEPFGSTAMAVRGIPTSTARIGAARALAAAIEGLTGPGAGSELAATLAAATAATAATAVAAASESGQSLPPEADRIVVALACHTAVKAGDALQPEEMRALVESLMSATDPFRCPHGRPVVTVVGFDQIERGFGRR